MNEPTEGRILLVGEGNFSLSASLVEGGTISGPQMIATCKETFTAVQENHQLAASNIDFLEKAGGTVLFEVDATDLHNHPDINFYLFDRVIFNFPLADRHNIKKNRDLLSDFFSSVKNILDPEKGQVMVTLCKGQGGTPADKPMRSWHDSWQVVSMAANAGLILTRIYPFQAEDFARYKSVGFRFQDKEFNTDSALIHVFEAAPSVSVPAPSPARCVVPQADQQFVVPAYIRRKHDRWSLLDKKDHPLCTLLHHIATRVSSTFPSITHLPSNSPLLPTVLPGYTSSLSAKPDMDGEGGVTIDSDGGQTEGSVMATRADSDERPPDAGVILPETGSRDSGQQGPSSKERKELENRQKVAAGPGRSTGTTSDSCQSTADDGKTPGGGEGVAGGTQQTADRAVPFQPFRHGVEREGVEGGDDRRSMTAGGRGVPSFPPVMSPVFVLHTLSQPDTPHAGHDRPTVLPPGAQVVADCEGHTLDAGDGGHDSTMETDEGEGAASDGDSSEAKKCKTDSDAVQNTVSFPANTLFHLRCSLLENLVHLRQHMKAKSKKAVFTSGIVYRQCPVSPAELAASHEILVLMETEDGCGELVNQLTGALTAVMDKDTAAQLTTTSMVKCVSVGETDSVEVNTAFTLQTKAPHSVTLGHIFTFKSQEHHGCGQERGTACRPLLGAVLYMDTILLHTLRLSDIRLLWSEDRRFLGQFSQGGFPAFRPISLYPVRFVHDISFWENPRRVFEEEELLDVVREVADDTVTSVTLVDCFDQADTGKTSRCYRLVFQSHDHALSYSSSWRLQSVLRLKVALQLGITLR